MKAINIEIKFKVVIPEKLRVFLFDKSIKERSSFEKEITDKIKSCVYNNINSADIFISRLDDESCVEVVCSSKYSKFVKEFTIEILKSFMRRNKI